MPTQKNSKKRPNITSSHMLKLLKWHIMVHPLSIQKPSNPFKTKTFLFMSNLFSALRKKAPLLIMRIKKIKIRNYKAPATIVKKNQVLLSISPKDLSFIAEDHLSDIFGHLAKFKIKINLMQNSAISFSICTDNNRSRINSLLRSLEKDYRVLRNEHLKLFTIRHYTTEVIDKFLEKNNILLEQKSRNTAQFVIK